MVPLIKQTYINFLLLECQTSQVIDFLVYSAIGPKSLRTAIASDNPDSFSTAKEKSVLLKFLNKNQGNFNNACKNKQQVLDISSWIKSIFSLSLFRPTLNNNPYRYADKTVMLFSVWSYQLEVGFLLMTASADLLIGHSVLLLHFSESRTRSQNSTKVPVFIEIVVIYICVLQSESKVFLRIGKIILTIEKDDNYS